MSISILDTCVLVTLAQADDMARLQALAIDSPAYAEYIRLRQRRTSPRKNRGEDSCVALALVTPGSVVYLDDGGGTRMALRELGSHARVMSSADL